MCESRILTIANLLIEQKNDTDMEKDTSGDVSSARIYDQIAIMCGSTDMVALIEVFIEKILQILIYTDG